MSDPRAGIRESSLFCRAAKGGRLPHRRRSGPRTGQAVADTTVTNLLKKVSSGEPRAADELLPLVYQELKRVAHHQLRDERRGHTLNTTDLVHEAYLRLGLQKIVWQGRVHFFAV